MRKRNERKKKRRQVGRKGNERREKEREKD